MHDLNIRVNTPNIVGCYMLRPFAHPAACCWVLLGVVAQSLKPVKRLSYNWNNIITSLTNQSY